MSDTHTLDIELMIDIDNNWEKFYFYKNVLPLNGGPTGLPLRICKDELVLSKLIPIVDQELLIADRDSKFIWAQIDLTEEEFLYLDLKYEITTYNQSKSLNLLYNKGIKCLDSHIKI